MANSCALSRGIVSLVQRSDTQGGGSCKGYPGPPYMASGGPRVGGSPEAHLAILIRVRWRNYQTCQGFPWQDCLGSRYSRRRWHLHSGCRWRLL